MNRKIPVILAWLLGACAITPPAVNRYDFGVPAIPGPETTSAVVDPIEVTVNAAPWLDTPAVLYRLSYADDSELHTYAQTAWVNPPARLLEQSFKSARTPPAAASCAGSSRTEPENVPENTRLAVDLQEFSQVFDTPQNSHVVLRARVRVLVARTRTVLAQRDFDLRAAAPTPDGPGAVHGLRDLSGTFAQSALEWATRQAPCAQVAGSVPAAR